MEWRPCFFVHVILWRHLRSTYLCKALKYWASCSRCCRYADDEVRDYGLTFNALEDRLSKRIDYAFISMGNTLFLKDISLIPNTTLVYVQILIVRIQSTMYTVFDCCMSVSSLIWRLSKATSLSALPIELLPQSGFTVYENRVVEPKSSLPPPTTWAFFSHSTFSSL